MNTCCYHCHGPWLICGSASTPFGESQIKLWTFLTALHRNRTHNNSPTDHKCTGNMMTESEFKTVVLIRVPGSTLPHLATWFSRRLVLTDITVSVMRTNCRNRLFGGLPVERHEEDARDPCFQVTTCRLLLPLLLQDCDDCVISMVNRTGCNGQCMHEQTKPNTTWKGGCDDTNVQNALPACSLFTLLNSLFEAVRTETLSNLMATLRGKKNKKRRSLHENLPFPVD